MGWADYGCPIRRTPEINELLKLMRIWYVDWKQGTGGLLHVELEDGNLYDDQINSDTWWAGRFEQIPEHLARERADGLIPDLNADEYRRVMERIIELLREMEEHERFTAYAWHHGEAQKLLASEIAPWDAWDTCIEVHPNSMWAKQNVTVETPCGKYTRGRY